MSIHDSLASKQAVWAAALSGLLQNHHECGDPPRALILRDIAVVREADHSNPVSLRHELARRPGLSNEIGRFPALTAILWQCACNAIATRQQQSKVLEELAVAAGPETLSEIDELCRRRFETAWRSGCVCRIEDYLPPPDRSEHLATLEELVHIDLEFHWIAWRRESALGGTPSRPAGVETYLSRFPKLDQPTIVVRLIEQEYLLRHKHGDSPSLVEYQGRYSGNDLSQITALSESPAQYLPAQTLIGPYRIIKVIGAGGMGVVYQAEDQQLHRQIALKVMQRGAAADPAARQRFLREARAAATLNHDHVMPIHQIGDDQGMLYLAMPLLDGETLEDRLRREKQLPITEILRIGSEIAEGLAAAHDRGLIHRDIKPANIWLERKDDVGRKKVNPIGGSDTAFRVKILDFGLARMGAEDTVDGEPSRQTPAAGDAGLLTQTDAVIGTPAYMSPEQASRLKIDARTDLYSLGAVLYRMATGRTPFAGDGVASLLAALQREKPVAPQLLNPKLPGRLSQLILSLLAKPPADRPQSASSVAANLAYLMEPRRRFRRAAAMTVALLAAATLALGLLRSDRKEDAIVEGPPRSDRIDPAEIERSIDFPPTIVVNLGENVKLELVRVPPGEFIMGSPIGESDAREEERPQHKVILTNSYYLGKFEVTQEQFSRYRENNSDFSSIGECKDQVVGIETRRLPAENVSWHDAMGYCMALNDHHRNDLPPALRDAGYKFILPTEAQWEYACRAGTNTPFSFGTICNGKQANHNGQFPYGTKEKGANLRRPVEVGQYAPNAFGLYDMHGNVWEWCQEALDGRYYEHSPTANPRNKTPGPQFVCRGGSWGYQGWACRSAFRHGTQGFIRFNNTGFRVALALPWNLLEGIPAAALPKDEQAVAGVEFDSFANLDAGLNPLTLAVGDLNGDGKADLVVCNMGEREPRPASPGTVNVFLGNGDGTFKPAIISDAGTQPHHIALADFNGDGKPDLAVINNWSHDVSILLGNGDGTVREKERSRVRPHPSDALAADFNSDGKMDLAVAHNYREGGISIMLGHGDGSFQESVFHPTGSVTGAILTGDLNGDGKLDLIASNYLSGSVSVLLAKGDGSFHGPKQIRLDEPILRAVADFDGDGKLDLAVSGNQTSKLHLFWGNGDGTFRTGPLTAYPGDSPGGAVVDINTDNMVDFICLSKEGKGAVTCLLGRGGGAFKNWQKQELGSALGGVAAGDFNGDGRPDLAVTAISEGKVRILLNRPAAQQLTVPNITAIAGRKTYLTVIAQDAAGNTAVGYSGTVRFYGTAGQQGFPLEYKFTPRDKGTHAFDGIVYPKAGRYSIIVYDSNDQSIGASGTVMVLEDETQKK